MDGIGVLEAALVVPLPAVGWKLLRLGAIQVGEGPGNSVEGGKVLLLSDRLKETPPYNLEALLCAGGSPHRFQTTERIAEAYDCLLSPLTTDLDIRGRDAGHQECLRGGLGSFSERLGE